MFVGHLGLGLLLSSFFCIGKFSTLTIFVLSQLLDIVFLLLAYVGQEKPILNGGSHPLCDAKWSHSLLGAIMISVAVFFGYWYQRTNQEAVMAFTLVFAHWIIDYIVLCAILLSFC